MLSIPIPSARRTARHSPAAALAARFARLRSAVPIHRPRFLRGARLEHAVRAPTIDTARVTLRPHQLSDADAWFDIQSDKQVLRYLPWPARSRAGSRQHLRHRTRHTRLEQSGDFLALAIDQGGELVGDVSLHLRQVDAEKRSVEIGWLLASHAGGNGLAAEAATALIDFAFTTVRARWVVAVMDARNDASLRLATRLGFLQISLADGQRTMVLPHP